MSDEITELPTKLNALPEETRWEAQKKRHARKIFAQVFSPFVKAMREAMSEFLRFRSQGVSREDGIAGINSVIRDVWPKAVTKFAHACDACDDTGYEEHICRLYVRCERHTCQRKGEEWQHRYVVLCSCEKGEGYRRWAMRKQAQSDEASIGKVNKPKKNWQRLGT